MDRKSGLEADYETMRLLEKLDRALDQSCTLRDIVRRREQLGDLEDITGPSSNSRNLRNEIRLMEQQLRAERARPDLDTDLPFSAV